MATTFSNKCDILGTLFIQEVDNPEFERFFEYNNIGLPLAYAQSDKMCEVSDKGIMWIENTWQDLMQALQIEDVGFDNLDEVFASAE